MKHKVEWNTLVHAGPWHDQPLTFVKCVNLALMSNGHFAVMWKQCRLTVAADTAAQQLVG